MSIERFNEIYPEWLRWIATGRKFLPVAGGLRDQPEDLMDSLLLLDGEFELLMEINKPKL